MDQTAEQPGLIKRIQRRMWMRYAMRNGGRDDPDQFDLAYRIADPWGMDSPGEQARFKATNALIASHFGPVGTLLEVACGEGHQSEHLAGACNRHYGIDISARAVERARRRLPDARLGVGNVFTLPWHDAPDHFDLVVACEMLYCLPDPAPTLARMRELGRGCLVTFFAPAARLVAPALDAIPGVQRDWFAHGGSTWLAAWWRND